MNRFDPSTHGNRRGAEATPRAKIGLPPVPTPPLVQRLLDACFAGCTCETKTPEPEHHDPRCHYRLFRESYDEITRLGAKA